MFRLFLAIFFSLNQTHFYSFDTVFPYLVLKIGIYRYTGDDPNVFSLKNQQQNKATKEDILTYFSYIC